VREDLLLNRIWVPLLCWQALLCGCAGAPIDPAHVEVPSEQLLDGQVFFGEEPLPQLPEVDILALDDDMKEFLAQHVQERRNDYLQLHQLLYAMIDEGIFGLEYDGSTRTARQTFHAQAGNCLSFTNMFVAMARDVGLNVKYQQVAIPPDWSQSGDTFVLNRHINVYINLGPWGGHVVDFNVDDMKANYERTVVSDDRAQAHYYNNIGVEKMQQRDARAAFLNFKRGIEADQHFAPLWTNLGTLYLRHRELVFAEASYRMALRIDARDMLAMSNLSRLYERQGDAQRAAYYRERVTVYRLRNPYYRYHLAKEAFQNADYKTSIEHLERAIRKKPGEDSFYFLLGLNYLQEGNSKRARRYFDKAEALAAEKSLKQNYRNKIDELLSGQS
jgi:Flp pilus assembly protein TadD